MLSCSFLDQILPGGGEDDVRENPDLVAMREVWEETGLKIIGLPGRFVMSKPLNKEEPIGSEKREDRFYICIGVVVGGKLQLNEKADDIRWFNTNQLPEHLFERHREQIQQMVDVDKQFIDISQDLHKLDIQNISL